MAAATSKKAAEPEIPTLDVSNQENVTTRSNPARATNKSQIRHRASIACASCRDRRIRCVVPKGETGCTQCKRMGTECIIKNDDERRRPVSKAYMSSLSDRINMLEGMLLDKGVVPPPPRHPPKTRHGAQTKTEDSRDITGGSQEPENKPAAGPRHSPLEEVPSPPDSGSDDSAMHDSPRWPESASIGVTDFQPLPKEQSPFRNLDPRQEDIVHRLLSTKGNLSFDQLSGRLRFFGPTANSHVYADSADKYDAREPAEQVRRAQRIIRSLDPDTYKCLMDTFWTYYNSILHVIDQEAFEGDLDAQTPKFYSSFLHITILAMGYFYSDRSRDDMKRITLGNRESILHREAKYMLDTELERPGGIPSVQALLILGDLECGVGRDNTGWMYAGMSNRLAFDVGLHLDCNNNELPEREVRIRQMVMRSCILYDKYWALFLGRPTSIKSQDIGMDLLAQRFTDLMSPKSTKSNRPATVVEQNLEIYEQLYELMELAGRIVEIRDIKSKRTTGPSAVFPSVEAEDNAYLHVVNLDRQLQNWYRRLPDHLTWKPSNIKTAEFTFFLLHQQYHVTMILLHRPWAKYTTIGGTGSVASSQPSPASAPSPPREQHDSKTSANTGQALGIGDPSSLVHDSRTSLSRSICTQQAIRVARIFWQHRQRFEGKRMFVTGIQHAGTASIALIAALAYQQTDTERRSYVSYLEILSQAINDMSETYQPAERMDNLLVAVLTQMRNDDPDHRHLRTSSFAGSVSNNSTTPWPDGSAYSTLPARREAPDGEHGSVNKKRPRPTPSRRASEIPRARPTFGTAVGMGNQTSSSSHVLSRSGNQQVSQPASRFYPTFGESSSFLDNFHSSAIDVDHAEDALSTRGAAADDYILVAPSADDWTTMNGLSREDHAAHGTSDHDFGFQMSNFVSGGGSSAAILSTPAPSLHDPRLAGSLLALGSGSGHLHHSLDSDGLIGGSLGAADEFNKATGDSAMEWINNGGTSLHAAMGLDDNDAHEGERSSSRLGSETASGQHRNHELDFFSF